MKRIGLIALVVLIMLSLLPLTASGISQYGTVTGGWLRLRTGPSYDATILKSYYTGTVVEILGTSGDWYNVKAPDNQAGYMLAAYITLGGGTGTTAYVTSANGYGVNLRTGPGKGYRVLAVYAVGTQVSVLQSGVIWSRIQVGTTVGYMMSEFLTTTPPGPTPTTPPSGDMATVWSANGYGVRLRSGPGTSYSIIGLYSVGTRVAVQTRGTTWDYILVGSRLGYMMNEFLHYDHPNLPIATGITVTPAYSTGMQDETVDLTVSVTGTDLSSPAYTLAVTGNSSMAEISGDDLHILSTATVGAVIEVTATTTDNDAGGNPLTDTCTVTVTAAEPRVTAFAFDETAKTVSIASGDVSVRVGYTISGYNLSSPYFSLAVSVEAGGHVTTSIDEATEEIVLNVATAVGDGTVFTVTGTTTADDAGGNPKTAVLTVTITSAAVTLTSIELVPEATALRYDETANINALLHYSDGSYATATITTQYTLAVTTGSTYASLSTKLLVPNDANLIGVADQTVVITGTSVADPSLTDTCDVLLYGRNEPDPPTLTSAVHANLSAVLHWTAPANDGGEDLTGYKAYYSLTEGGAKNLLSDAILPSATSYTATGLINGTLYYFWLTADNGRGDSDYSNYLTATPNPTQPSAPQTLTVSDRGDGFVELTWTAPADTGGSGVLIDHYRVYVDNVEYDVAGRSSALTKTVTGLTNAQSYEFMVIAVNSAEVGLPATITSNPVGTPDAPTIGTKIAGFESIAITWTPATYTGGNAIQSYDVYIKIATDPDPVVPTDTVTDTEYTFTCATDT
ncbi:MAG: SH3 domain-containing protein, partial [Bacillota bacterium]